MSLINQALKKAQKHSQQHTAEPPGLQQTQHSGHQTQPPHWDGTAKRRWYLVLLLLGPALAFPVISSKWSRDKRLYREEIEILAHTPIKPVSKYDFQEDKNNESPKASLALESTPKAIEPPQGSRSFAQNTPDPSISRFVNQSRISSIRAAGENSKVVINNRTVAINSYIEDGLPVRVSKVSPNEIVFIDDNGCEYYRRF